MSKTVTAEKLKPYVFHGMEFTLRGEEALGDCPFCTREGKFSVKVETGQWRCLVCNEGGQSNSNGNKGGNIYSFLRLLWEHSPEEGLAELAANRGLVGPEVLSRFGIRKSLITSEWIIPGYNGENKLNTLYRYSKLEGKMKVLATSGLGHGLFRVTPTPQDKPKGTLYLCEGVWDACALWEMLKGVKASEEGKLTPTANVNLSLLHDADVVATPGCNVFQDNWKGLFSSKKVVVCFDNDHPRTHPKTKSPIAPAAYEGMKRVADLLAFHDQPPKSLHWLAWGDKGYDLSLPSGMDLRDQLGQGGRTFKGRIPFMQEIMDNIEPIPKDILPGRTKDAVQSGATDLQLKPCHDWKKLTLAWRKTFRWTEGLDRALSVMLACITSTKCVGDQLWVKIISPPSGGKSSLCEALCTAKKYVVGVSTLRGFHSGYKSDESGKEDNSLISMLLDKTLVTKDGDTLLTSPELPRILSEARDLYDGTSNAHYRHGLQRNYQGLRITWILCGTAALLTLDGDTELGARFLNCHIMNGIDEDMEREIIKRKVFQANAAVKQESNGVIGSQHTPSMLEAMQMTGGYVEYLRANANDLLNKVEFPEAMMDQVVDLGIFVAFMRARPSLRQKEAVEREMGTRLASQLVRLANCLAVVLNKQVIDGEVMRRVRQTALDTARGRTLELVKFLYGLGDKGGETKSIAISTGQAEEEERKLLKFLRIIKGVELHQLKITTGLQSKPRWRLTPYLKRLYMLATEQEQYEEE